MNQTLIEEQADDELTDVKSEQIRVLFAATPSSLFTILVSSLVLAIVQWPVIDHVIIVAWFAVINLLSLIRLQLYRQFKKLGNQRLIDDVWYSRAVATGIVSGITWGAGGFFLFADHSLVHQVFLGFVVAGMCAGAITTLAAIINSARAFVVIALLPVIIKFHLMDSEISVAMTFMSILFMVMILISAQRLHQTIVESLSGRHQREVAEQTVRRQALYDELTDLPNRRLLLKILRQEMAKAHRHQRYGALFFIDLDRFKSINDSLGHAVGDDLLVAVAKTISSRLRHEDTAARLGGDEFVVLLPEVGADAESAGSHASRIADEVRNMFADPLVIQGHKIELTISIGIALFPMDVTAEELLSYADVAMYQAKNDGRDKTRLFSTEMQDAVNHLQVVEKGLRNALENNEFELYYQAQYDADEQMVGAEALLRWHHPQKGIIAPDQFIDTAEQTGLIVPIGDWVLRSACEHLVRLNSDLILSVNVSSRQFSDADFSDRLKEILLETGADAHNLKIEITESLAIANIERTVDTMNVIKQLGISFSVDDFGTGYSSLNYLHRLPVDELKIDQSFVRNVSSASDNAVIVDTILVMARQLKLEVVAEGVESEAEYRYLKERDCTRFQGFYLSRPEPFVQFTELTVGT